MKHREEDQPEGTSDPYRESLMRLWEKATSAYGKSVLALSGGALGVSLSVLKDLIVINNIRLGWAAWVAWLSWASSLSCVLFSYAASATALLKAVNLYDHDKEGYAKKYQNLSHWVKRLNIFGGVLFIAGLIFWIIFMWFNLPIPLNHAPTTSRPTTTAISPSDSASATSTSATISDGAK